MSNLETTTIDTTIVTNMIEVRRLMLSEYKRAGQGACILYLRIMINKNIPSSFANKEIADWHHGSPKNAMCSATGLADAPPGLILPLCHRAPPIYVHE